jgi:hypothetical protein
MSDYNSNGSVPPLIPGDIYVSQAVFTGSVKMTSDSTAPNMLVTEATSLMGLFGATAVGQRTTTSGTGAALTFAGTAAPVLIDTTFDGYTVAEVVQALRQYGMLA